VISWTRIRANTPKLEDISWFSEAHTALEVVDLNPTIATAQFISTRYTKHEWKKVVRTKVEAFDEAELHQSLFRIEYGIFYSTLKTKYGPEPYVFAHDRRSSMLKFYLRSRSYGLQARIHHGAANHSAKRCKCTLGAEENEEHYLLTCPALAAKRRAFARNLVIKLTESNYTEELRNIRTAPNNELIAYLLGGSEINWNDGAILLIDELMRPYLLKLASKRKHLMAALNDNGGTSHSTP
jgi:hypothetical protein